MIALILMEVRVLVSQRKATKSIKPVFLHMIVHGHSAANGRLCNEGYSPNS